MNEKNNRYVIRGSEWVKKPMPSTEQIEEKSTNKEIECKICTRMVKNYVRIVRINGSSAYLNGVCCDRCIFTHKFKHGIYLIDNENKVFTPETITIGQVIPTNDRGWLDDVGKGEQRIKEIEKYRNSVKNMIRINKALGIFMPTYKQEMLKKIDEVSWLDDDLKRAIYEKIKSGEIKIE